MRTAFAHWESRIAPVFDTARQIHVIELAAGEITHEFQAMLPEELPMQKALELVKLEVGTLVCGAISRPMHNLVIAYGVQVVPFVAGELGEVMRAWVTGTFKNEAFAMPGCCRRNRRRGCETRSRANIANRQRPLTSEIGERQQPQPRRCEDVEQLVEPFAGTHVCVTCGYSKSYAFKTIWMPESCPKCGTTMIRQG